MSGKYKLGVPSLIMSTILRYEQTLCKFVIMSTILR